MKFFVYHNYDVDGGIGDAVPQKKLIGILNVEYVRDPIAAAEEWAKKHTHKHIYDIPYAALYEGIISVEPMDVPVYTLNDCPWTEEQIKNLEDPRTTMERMMDDAHEEEESMKYDPEYQQYLEDCANADYPEQ